MTSKLELIAAVVGSEENPDARLLLATTLFASVLQNLIRSADKPQMVDDATAVLSEIVCASETAIRMWGGKRPGEGRHAVNLAVGLLDMLGTYVRYDVEQAEQVATLFRMLSESLNRVAEQLEMPEKREMN